MDWLVSVNNREACPILVLLRNSVKVCLVCNLKYLQKAVVLKFAKDATCFSLMSSA